MRPPVGASSIPRSFGHIGESTCATTCGGVAPLRKPPSRLWISAAPSYTAVRTLVPHEGWCIQIRSDDGRLLAVLPVPSHNDALAIAVAAAALDRTAREPLPAPPEPAPALPVLPGLSQTLSVGRGTGGLAWFSGWAPFGRPDPVQALSRPFPNFATGPFSSRPAPARPGASHLPRSTAQFSRQGAQRR